MPLRLSNLELTKPWFLRLSLALKHFSGPQLNSWLIVVFPVLHWDRTWLQDSTCAHDIRSDVQMGVITSTASCPPVDESVSLHLEFCYVDSPVALSLYGGSLSWKKLLGM